MSGYFSAFTPGELIRLPDYSCPCGKTHKIRIDDVIVEAGAVTHIPEVLKRKGLSKPYVISGSRSFSAAGRKVLDVLESDRIEYTLNVINRTPVIPDEYALGNAVMNFPADCDSVIGIGSGVINDISKIVSEITGKYYIIVATAPSMDGYASPSSSMEKDGLKITMPSKYPDVIIGDTDIISKAPRNMLLAGVGDMFAKYTALCEWRISALINGEYFCEEVYDLMLSALNKCRSCTEKLLTGDKEAAAEMMYGLIKAGIAMEYAGVSRPASGTEHYFSHTWDMRSLSFGTKSDLHGIQCGISTLYTIKVLNFIKTVKPDKEKALKHAREFDFSVYSEELKDFIGEGAAQMISLEKKEQKYCVVKHKDRLRRIIENLDGIVEIINTLPPYDKLKAFYEKIGFPVSAAYLGFTDDVICKTFLTTKDIRDKYISSRLVWDLGEEDNACKVLIIED